MGRLLNDATATADPCHSWGRREQANQDKFGNKSNLKRLVHWLLLSSYQIGSAQHRVGQENWNCTYRMANHFLTLPICTKLSTIWIFFQFNWFIDLLSWLQMRAWHSGLLCLRHFPGRSLWLQVARLEFYHLLPTLTEPICNIFGPWHRVNGSAIHLHLCFIPLLIVQFVIVLWSHLLLHPFH